MTVSMEKRLKPLEGAPPDGLMIHEIYVSIQGESTRAGIPCVFIRTTACNLRCVYCDTPHAFGQGEARSLESVLEEVRGYGVDMVEVTGGEPLLQPNVLPLLKRLCDEGFTVLLETGGHLDISSVDDRVIRIVDLKTPSSGELESNCYDNVEHLRLTDEVKFVLGSRKDYEWARDTIAKYELTSRCAVLMGAVFGDLEPELIVSWILEDGLSVRFQLQMHKYIWNPRQRGV